MPRKMTRQEFVEKAQAKFDGYYSYDKVEYVNSVTKVTVTCSKHGDFSIRPNDHLSMKGCRKCADERHANRSRLTREEFIDKARQIHGDKYSYDKVEYKACKIKVAIICPVHGVFYQTPGNHLQGYGCNACGYDATAKKNTAEDTRFEQAARMVHGDKYDYSKAKYVHGKRKVEIICKKHGSFFMRPNGHVSSGQGCPSCSTGNTSKAEKEIAESLGNLGISGWTTNRRDVIRPLEIDLYNEGLKLAVEINGEYWHTERRGKDKTYHENKRKMCADKGIMLLQFGWKEWVLKRAIVESMIAVKSGAAQRRIFARKCKIADLSNKDAEDFCNANHLKGWASASIRKGLFADGELVAVATFAKSRFDSKHDLECVRLCAKLNTHVVGAAGKLFGSLPKGMRLLTYADKRHGVGNVYKQIGMECIGETACGYVWVNDYGKDIKSRYECQKHKLAKWLPGFDPAKTEVENMEAAGYSRLWDCGNVIYSKET